MNKIKIALGVALASPLALLAEESAGSGDSSMVSTIAGAAQTAIEQGISDASSPLQAILTAGLGIAIAFIVVRLLLRGLRVGTGR